MTCRARSLVPDGEPMRRCSDRKWPRSYPCSCFVVAELKPYICRLHGPCPYAIQSILVLSAAWFEQSGRTAATSSIFLNCCGNLEGYIKGRRSNPARRCWSGQPLVKSFEPNKPLSSRLWDSCNKVSLISISVREEKYTTAWLLV